MPTRDPLSIPIAEYMRRFHRYIDQQKQNPHTHLGDLRLSTRFRVKGAPTLTGRVVKQGRSGTRVAYRHNGRKKKPTVWSRGTQVEVIHD